MQDVAFGDFTLTEREALFEDSSNSIEVKMCRCFVNFIIYRFVSLFGKMGLMKKVNF